MHIIGDPATIKMLHPDVRRFLDSAWSPPSTSPKTAGFRQRQQTFPEQFDIMYAAALAISRAIKKEHVRYNCVKSAAGWDFSRHVLDTGKREQVYRDLVEAWNSARDLGECQFCGTLFSPRKGRIAKFCSDRCRMEKARSA